MRWLERSADFLSPISGLGPLLPPGALCPRTLEEIRADILAREKETVGLLGASGEPLAKLRSREGRDRGRHDASAQLVADGLVRRTAACLLTQAFADEAVLQRSASIKAVSLPMFRTQPQIASLALLALASSGLAQQSLVLPHGMAFVEGPSVSTYPFGRTTAAIQLLYDAPAITLGQGVITGMRFRQSQVTAAQTHPGYTKNYLVTAYQVSATAATMSADPAVNAGSSPGTIVWNGPLVLPPVQPLAVQPASFSIDLPFQTPLVFDGSLGNLMLVVETADQVAVAAGYRVDAVSLSTSTATGLTASIDAGACVSAGRSLALTMNASSAVVGGAMEQQYQSAVPGSLPLLFAGIGLGVQSQDLSSLGMLGCTLSLQSFATNLVVELPGGGYPLQSFAVPNAPWAEGLAFSHQGFGLAASGLLSESVVSNSVAVRIGGSTGARRDMGMSFRTTGSWSMGTGVVYVAVVELLGTFP